MQSPLYCERCNWVKREKKTVVCASCRILLSSAIRICVFDIFFLHIRKNVRISKKKPIVSFLTTYCIQREKKEQKIPKNHKIQLSHDAKTISYLFNLE